VSEAPGHLTTYRKEGNTVALSTSPDASQIWISFVLSAAASFLIGGAVALIAVAIFAVTLRRLAERNPSDAIKALQRLIGIVLGGGLIDYAVFDYIVKTSGALTYYALGFGLMFLVLGVPVFNQWRKLP